MRYSSLPSFFGHLEQASQQHLSQLYGIFCADSAERLYLATKVLDHFSGTFTKVDSLPCLEKILEQPSLFDSVTVFWLETETLVAQQEHLLAKVLANPALRLVVTCIKPGLPHFFEEKGVLLSLIPDKKWEKDQRASFYLQEKAKMYGKVLEPQGLQEFLARSNTGLQQRFSDLDKLCTYVGDKKVVGLQDVEKIIGSYSTSNIWQKAQQFVWEKRIPFVDKAEIPLFFARVRKEMQMGYILSSCTDPYKAKHLFPKVWPSLFAKKASLVRKLGQAYFRSGMIATFFAEKEFRETGLFDPIVLYANVTTST